MSPTNAEPPQPIAQRLAAARKARGLTQEQAAAHLGCSRPTLIAIEKGTRPAKPEEIVTLAEFYGRSVHDIVKPHAPVVELQPHLRAAIDASRVEVDVLDETILLFQRFAEDYCELERIVGAEPVTSYPPEVSLRGARQLVALAESAAVRERHRLYLGDQPILSLRDLLETDVGIRIFCLPMPSAIAGLYAFVADLGHCILINLKHPQDRRRFTLAHEYAHFMCDRHKPGIDYLSREGKKPSNEKFADAFAAGFLMPETSVRRRFLDVTASTGDFQVADLCRLSTMYGVSVQAMALRLEQFSLIPRGSWDFLVEKDFKPSKARGELDLLPPRIESEDPFPQRYKHLAVLAFRQEKITEGQLMEFLRCGRVDAREIVEESLSRRDLGEAGLERMLHMPFERSLLTRTS